MGGRKNATVVTGSYDSNDFDSEERVVVGGGFGPLKTIRSITKVTG